MPEVAITGIGLVTPCGTTAGETLAALREGAPAHREVLGDEAGARLAGRPVAAPPPFDLASRIGGRKLMKFMCPAAQYGCSAAREAVDASAVLDRHDPRTVGLFSATGISGASTEEVLPMLEGSLGADGRVDPVLLGRQGLPRANPLLSFRLLANMPGTLIGIITGIRGYNLILSPWEEQGMAVIREAFLAVADGSCPAALVGAADDMANQSGVAHLLLSGLLPEGTLPSAGAAYLVFERAEAVPANRLLATLTDVAYDRVDGAQDPLAGTLGRTYAAAPAILLALAAGGAAVTPRVSGHTGRRCTFSLESAT